MAIVFTATTTGQRHTSHITKNVGLRLIGKNFNGIKTRNIRDMHTLVRQHHLTQPTGVLPMALSIT